MIHQPCDTGILCSASCFVGPVPSKTRTRHAPAHITSKKARLAQRGRNGTKQEVESCPWAFSKPAPTRTQHLISDIAGLNTLGFGVLSLFFRADLLKHPTTSTTNSCSVLFRSFLLPVGLGGVRFAQLISTSGLQTGGEGKAPHYSSSELLAIAVHYRQARWNTTCSLRFVS